MQKNIWIIAAKFPNTIQPWLANSVIQAALHGNHVRVISTQPGDKIYASKLDELNLTANTIYIPLGGKDRKRNIFRNFLVPSFLIRSLKGLIRIPKYLSQYRSASTNIVSSLNLAPYITDQNISLIHCHSEPAGHQLLPIIRAQKCPVVITFHGLPPVGVRPLSEHQRAEYTNLANIILVNTEFAKKQYISLGASSDKLRIMPQGTDTNRFALAEKSDPTSGPIKILSVGRFHPDKGHEYALTAIARLTRKGFDLDYTLVGSGPEKTRLEAFAKEQGLKDKVHFRSGLSEEELITEYQNAHIFLFPSVKSKDGFHEETQGVAIQEAQACGAIVISTFTGGIPECVINGENAYLVEDRNSDAIETQLGSLIEQVHEWPEIRSRARLWVEENYDISVIGNRMQSLYDELIQIK